MFMPPTFSRNSSSARVSQPRPPPAMTRGSMDGDDDDDDDDDDDASAIEDAIVEFSCTKRWILRERTTPGEGGELVII